MTKKYPSFHLTLSAISTFVAFAFLSAARADDPKPMVVRVPIANIRNQPVEQKMSYDFDPLQETQVEEGEPVLVWDTKDEWAHVECPDQLEYTHNDRWEGYPGWIKLSDLTSDLSKLRSLKKKTTNEKKLREEIVRNAMRHLGAPYVWGGRSLYNSKDKNIVTGVDCSGLINWSFRKAGWAIPRDAHEQYMKAHPILPTAMKPADLIFVAKTTKKDKIVHVMMYLGNGMAMEAPQTGETVRKFSLIERFQMPLSQMQNGMQLMDRVYYFGTFFDESL